MFRTGEKDFYIFWENILQDVQNRWEGTLYILGRYIAGCLEQVRRILCILKRYIGGCSEQVRRDFIYFGKIYWRALRTGEKEFNIFCEDILQDVQNRWEGTLYILGRYIAGCLEQVRRILCILKRYIGGCSEQVRRDFIYFGKIYWRALRTGEKRFYIFWGGSFWEDIL